MSGLAIFDLPAAIACVLADGEGGWFDEAGSGRRASEQTILTVGSALNKHLTASAGADVVAQIIREAIVQADADIVAATQRSQTDRVAAAAIVAVWPRGFDLHIAGVGDCRAYLVRAGRLQLLTRDDTVARALVDVGAISAAEALVSPMRHVLHKYLGCSDLGSGPEVLLLPIQVEDCVLLCTGGLHQYLAEESILEHCSKDGDVQVCAKALCEHAQRSGSRDDISCIVLKFTV